LRRRSGEDGLATTELAILFPVVIAVVLGIVQVALWAHAGAVAQAAADHGAEVAAAFGSSDAAGMAAAQDFAMNAGTITNVAVSANNPSASELVAVTVSGSYPTVFGTKQVSATSTTVRERLPD